MLPPKIGEGVFGSNSGGVNPTGASSFFSGAFTFSSAAALTVVLGKVVNLRGLGVVKDKVVDCFHGTGTRSLGLGPDRGGVKREAWVAMAILRIGYKG